MKYYNIVNNKVELTEVGQNILKQLGITKEGLVNITIKDLETLMCKKIESCRIPFSSENDMKSSETGYTSTGHQAYGKSDIYGDAFKRACQDDDKRVHPSPRGRFPANLLCSSYIDLDLNALLDLQKVIKEQS